MGILFCRKATSKEFHIALVCLKYSTYTNMRIAHNDNTEALKDTKGLTEYRGQDKLRMVLMSFSQSPNMLTFGKPVNYPIATSGNI